MSYKPPYGFRLPLQYTVTYTPPVGGSVAISFSNQEKITGFVAPNGFISAVYGTALIGNKSPSIKPQSINALAFGTASISNKARVLFMQGAFPGKFGSAVVRDTRLISPPGINSIKFGQLFSVVLGYYSPVYGGNIPIAYGHVYQPPVGRGIPIDYKNTHTFRQAATYSINPGGFGRPTAANKATGVNLSYFGIRPGVAGTPGLANKTHYIKPAQFYLGEQFPAPTLEIRRNTINVHLFPTDSYGTPTIVLKNRHVYPTPIDNTGYVLVTRPVVHNVKQFLNPVAMPPNTFGRVTIGPRVRTVKTSPFSVNGLGVSNLASVHNARGYGIAARRVSPSGFSTYALGAVSVSRNRVYCIGFLDDKFGQARVHGNVIGPVQIPYNSSMFGKPKLRFTQYISPPEIEPKVYNDTGPPINFAAGCGSSFIGVPQLSPHYIDLNSTKHSEYIVDYVINNHQAPDYFGTPVVTHGVRFVSMAPTNFFELFGHPSVMNKNRAIYPAVFAAQYYGIPKLNNTRTISPYWGTDPLNRTPTSTDAYGAATVRFASRVGPFTQYCAPPGIVSFNSGASHIDLKNRHILVPSIADGFFYPIAIGPRRPIATTFFTDSVFGNNGISFRIRKIQMQGFMDEQIGVGFSGASTDVVKPMKVYNARQIIDLAGNGIEPNEPLIGFSCSRWERVGAIVSHRT